MNMTIKVSTLLLCLSLLFQARAQSGYQSEIKQYATQLYASLGKFQKQTGLLNFNDTSRLKWNNLPVGLRARAGMSIGNMNNDQRRLVHRILSASLSSQGYLKATGIMYLDELINGFYDSLYVQKTIDEKTYAFVRNLKWSPKNYYFAFFGSPSDATWGYKLEGHHLSVNFTFTGDKISVTPLFVGTDPAEYLVADYAGWRVLNQEEDLGLRLINSMTEPQKKKAIKSVEVPRDIITSAESGKRLVENWGIKSSELDKAQQTVLQSMIREYVFNMEFEKATLEYDKIQKAGMDNIYFGWIGALEEKQGHYYVINGPTFLIEFDNYGGPRNSANHIHSIWREKGNEYGEDVLKKHYQAEKH
ncbi:MAG: DUF3500 domain-containing protein [Bacteroidetes bacterium]|nr:DUF3500 domain-containing protein [Bacteroidota bacterium]